MDPVLQNSAPKGNGTPSSPHDDNAPPSSAAIAATSIKTGRSKPSKVARIGQSVLIRSGKHILTLAIALVAGLVAYATWQYYVTSPWTRNGSVRVQVANIAPQVSGKIVDLKVVDNQFVHQGDVLYVIDPVDFQIAVRTDKAMLEQRAADLNVKQLEAERRLHLSDLATTPEEQQIYASNAAQAKALYDAAAHQLAQAELNFERTTVLSPVDGYVTNLLLRVGDYAVTGASNISVIDSGSFWVDGYFEETKMGGICIGDRAEALLMGYSEPIVGHIQTVTRGVSVSNAASGTQGLPSVDPIYTWVRLAQRVPVRVAIDHVPAGVPLVSGMTATVTVRPAGPQVGSAAERLRDNVFGPIAALFSAKRPSRPNCLPIVSARPNTVDAIVLPTEPPIPSPSQILPGLAPGMTEHPKL